METKVFVTPAAPTPVGSYSQAVQRGSIIAVSGMVALDPATGKVVEGGIAEQTAQVLTNIEAILEAAGTSFAEVISLRVYLADGKDFAEMNRVYTERITEPYPTRATVFVGLPPGFLVEIEALAVV